MDRRAWWATVHGVTKSWTRLSDLTNFHCVKWASPEAQWVKNPPVVQETVVRFLDREDPLEEDMATYSSILV